jgi:hypothetical protein
VLDKPSEVTYAHWSPRSPPRSWSLRPPGRSPTASGRERAPERVGAIVADFGEELEEVCSGTLVSETVFRRLLPGELPTAGLLDDLARKNGLKGQKLWPWGTA